MKRLICLILSLALALSLTTGAFAAAEDEIVKINFDDEHQTMDGFGASYTWYLGWAVKNNQAETIWDWVFNETEFNIIRFRDLNEVINADEAQMAVDGYPEYYAVYDAAVKRGVDPTVLVTSWGEYRRDLDWVVYVEDDPSSKASYYTLAKDENGEYRYDDLAQFCVQSIKYFFDAGIPVDYFSISNEVELQDDRMDENGKSRDEAGFFFGTEESEYHCCYWKAFFAVYDAFEEAFGEFAPKLVGAETMAAWPDLVSGYLDPIFEQRPETVELVGHHLYGMQDYGGFEPRNFAAVKEAAQGRPIWMTEWYDTDYFGHAEVIVDELVNEDISAYLYWSGVWAPDMGLCLIEVASDDPGSNVQRMGNHYILQHFTKFIKKGYVRLGTEDKLGTKFAAFRSPDSGKLAVVAMNPNDTDDYMTLDLGGREILGSRVLLSTENDNMFLNKYLEDLGEYEDELCIPARSLMTIEIDLEPDPNYVEPVVEEVVNPFVKTPKKGLGAGAIIAIVAAVCCIVIAVIAAAVIGSKKSKKAENKPAEEAETEAGGN